MNLQPISLTVVHCTVINKNHIHNTHTSHLQQEIYTKCCDVNQDNLDIMLGVGLLIFDEPVVISSIYTPMAPFH